MISPWEFHFTAGGTEGESSDGLSETMEKVSTTQEKLLYAASLPHTKTESKFSEDSLSTEIHLANLMHIHMTLALGAVTAIAFLKF